MRHKAHVAHHTKGRLRIRVPSAKGDPAALQEIARTLSPVMGVSEVIVNETTGVVKSPPSGDAKPPESTPEAA